MIGSVIASAGLFLSAFSNDVATLMVSNGVIAGTGLGMVNLFKFIYFYYWDIK